MSEDYPRCPGLISRGSGGVVRRLVPGTEAVSDAQYCMLGTQFLFSSEEYSVWDNSVQL